MAMATESDGFQARLKRINDPRNVSYYDPELKMNVPKQVSKGIINCKHAKRIGLAYIAVQVISGQFGLLPSLELVLFGMAVVLGGLMRHKTLLHMGAQVMGVGLMMASAHNAVWMFPDAVSYVTSTAYVTQRTS